MSPYTYPLANALFQASKGVRGIGDQIAEIFSSWPAQRKKELYDLLIEEVHEGMKFKDLVTACDEALYANAIDWQHSIH